MAREPVNFEQGDDLSDLLGDDVAFRNRTSALTSVQPPRALPQAAEYVRIRAEVPAFEEICRKCGGTGAFRSYSGRTLGDCFACKGKGKKVFATSPQDRAAARQRTVDAKVAVRNDHKAEIEWLANKIAKGGLPAGYENLLGDLLSKLNNGKELTEGQLGVIRKGQARDAEFAAKRVERAQERVQAAPGIDASKIAEAFQRAQAAGLSKIGLYFEGLAFFPAKKYPGTIYVKAGKAFEATYYGKITEGRFVASRDCTAEIQARIIQVAADPMAAAQAYGYETGICCVCSRELTNKESVETGIGPICAGRLGWTPGGLKRQAGVDF